MSSFDDSDGIGGGDNFFLQSLGLNETVNRLCSLSVKDKRSYSCPVCEKSFSEDRLIKSHIKTNHPGKLDILE